jgi:hypothetical protein
VHYKNWKQQTGTAGISRKAGKLSESLITEAYVSRFNQELNKLGATKIKVELVKSGTRQGVVLHELKLKNTINPSVKISDILSEGEHRIIALAACLADVTGNGSSSPFIFDDPISSLDQDYEWRVATRLAELATDRQVIVFTHRLSLFGGITDEAKNVFGTNGQGNVKGLNLIFLESYENYIGSPSDSTLSSVNTQKANTKLLTQLDEGKRLLDTGNFSAYKLLAQGICSEFRKLVERSVEEDLISKVVLRHRRSVTTDNRIENLAKITTNDCSYLDGLMSKYSAYMHSQSTETPIEFPPEPELRDDIEGLKTWRETFKQR